MFIKCVGFIYGDIESVTMKNCPSREYVQPLALLGGKVIKW